MEMITAKQAHEMALSANEFQFELIMQEIEEYAKRGSSQLTMENIPDCIVKELEEKGYDILTMQCSISTSRTIKW